MLRTWPFLALTVAGVACSSPPLPNTPSEAPPIPSASAAPPTVASAASATPPPEQPPPEEGAELDCSEEEHQRRKAKVEEAKKSGPDAMAAAIDRALETNPRDIDLWTRKAQQAERAGDIGGASALGRVLVEVSNGENAYGWFLQGLEAEQKTRPQEARAYFARAAHHDPRGEGARKLGNRSRCTAIPRLPDKKDALEILRGWKEVFKQVNEARMVREDKPEPRNEAEAKARTCINGNLNEITERDVCKGNGPWEIQTGHMHFHDFMVVVVPLSNNRFVLVSYATGMPCRGGSSSTVRLQGDILEVTTQANLDLLVSTSTCDSGLHDALSPPCIASSELTTRYYDTKTGKALLYLEDHNPTETFDLKGTSLHRSGPQGCDETLDLKKLPVGLTPRPNP